jgi:hypothetical protein
VSNPHTSTRSAIRKGVCSGRPGKLRQSSLETHPPRLVWLLSPFESTNCCPWDDGADGGLASAKQADAAGQAIAPMWRKGAPWSVGTSSGVQI